MDLITLLSRPEGKTLEFKRDLSSPDGVLKAIVAFANTSGGVLVLGVEDGTKRVKGFPNILAEEERLAKSDCRQYLAKAGPLNRSDALAKDSGLGGRDLSKRQPAPFF